MLILNASFYRYLYVTGMLDREYISQYNLTVSVWDGMHVSNILSVARKVITEYDQKKNSIEDVQE